MDDFPRKEVWVNFVPTKITSFVWQVFCGLQFLSPVIRRRYESGWAYGVLL
ncbi:hypothetical protein LINPERHAP1_LOCUS25228 [Linum perenne]